MRFFRKPYRWAIFYACLLFAFTLFVALDTFVIPRAYVALDGDTARAEETDAAADSGAAPDAGESGEDNSGADDPDTENPVFTGEPVITENAYSDANISITVTEYREYDTAIYVADIYLSSADYLKTAFAENTYGRNIKETTSEIAEKNGAVLAINGDYYGTQNAGYVLRNGVVYRETASGSSQEDLVIYSDGSFGIVTEGSVTVSELLEDGAVQVLSFGPGLVEDGELAVTGGEEVDKSMTSNPRTAIGAVGPLHYVMVVSDGRTGESAGLTLYQLASFMRSLGVATAYNLDGGGSSTMVFNGAVVNNPTTSGKKIAERSVSDIVYIG